MKKLMKRWMLLFLLLTTMGFAQTGQNATPRPPSKQNPTQECQHLSDQEKLFASKLSPPHRSTFCRHFSVAQRIEAMALADSPIQKAGSNPISPDEAVEIVMKNARTKKPPEKSTYSYPKRSSGN